jgi:hypothetical protein
MRQDLKGDSACDGTRTGPRFVIAQYTKSVFWVLHAERVHFSYAQSLILIITMACFAHANTQLCFMLEAAVRLAPSAARPCWAYQKQQSRL